MLWHLKGEDFVSLMEGMEVAPKLRRHLESCVRCRTTWESVRSVHSEISSMDAEVPEPEWDQFRSSVRNQLLSRSVQRQSAVRRWTGWSIRPAAAWALSLLMAVGVTTMSILWEVEKQTPAQTDDIKAVMPADTSPEVLESVPEKSLFDDVLSLGEEQQEQFREMLESAPKGLTSIQ